MMKKFRRFILKHGTSLEISLSFVAVVVALSKISILSTQQIDLNGALIEITKSHTYAIDALRDYQETHDPDQMDSLKKHLHEASVRLVEYTGKNPAVCVSQGVVFTVQPVKTTPIDDLVAQDLSASMKQSNGQKCENEILDKGKFYRMQIQDFISDYAELALALIAIFLIWVKIESSKFENHFPPRRKNDNKIPFYLND